MEQSCLMDQASARDKFMSDPFDIKEKELDKIEDENIKNIIQISIIKKYAAILGIDASTITQNIYNYIGNGKVFNLPNSQIILGNNISIELTTNELELLKLLNLKKPETVITAITKNNTIKEEDIAQAGQELMDKSQPKQKHLHQHQPQHQQQCQKLPQRLRQQNPQQNQPLLRVLKYQKMKKRLCLTNPVFILLQLCQT